MSVKAMRESLRTRAKDLKRQLSAVYYASLDPRVGLPPKIVIGICIAYALSPIDLIPDFIPVLGYLDDLVIIPALIGLAIKLIPREVFQEAKERAEREPVSLKRNWAFAVLLAALWAAVIALIVGAAVAA
jgi:uncharacterized membrane protein YkvA (DUF1232 family)